MFLQHNRQLFTPVAAVRFRQQLILKPHAPAILGYHIHIIIIGSRHRRRRHLTGRLSDSQRLHTLSGATLYRPLIHGHPLDPALLADDNHVPGCLWIEYLRRNQLIVLTDSDGRHAAR